MVQETAKRSETQLTTSFGSCRCSAKEFEIHESKWSDDLSFENKKYGAQYRKQANGLSKDGQRKVFDRVFWLRTQETQYQTFPSMILDGNRGVLE